MKTTKRNSNLSLICLALFIGCGPKIPEENWRCASYPNDPCNLILHFHGKNKKTICEATSDLAIRSIACTSLSQADNATKCNLKCGLSSGSNVILKEVEDSMMNCEINFTVTVDNQKYVCKKGE